MPGLDVARISRLAISIVLIALGVTQTAPVEVNAAGESWFSSSWQFRKSITIDATKVSSGPHTNFPVLVNLSSDASLAANAQADADDILFTSSGGATQLSHEIEKYGSATGELVAWVKVASLSSSSNTVLYMYYGNASAASQQDATGVWNSNYEAVWHLKETPTNAADEIKDSTLNGRHGTTVNMETGDQMTGQIGGSMDFDGGVSNERIDTKNFMSSGVSQLTAQAWVFKDTTKDARIVYKNNAGNTGNPVFGLASGGVDLIRARVRISDGSGADQSSTATISLNTWTFVAFTYDGSNIRIYKNGVLDTTVAETGTLAATADVVVIAQNEAGVSVDRHWPGQIDEVRLSNTARSTGWLLTEYNNQNSPTTFYAVGAVENVPIPPTVSSTSPANGAAGVAINSSIAATFSETMQSSTINTNTFTVSDGSANIIGTVFYSGTTATFTPSSNLSDSTTYTARIASGVRDLAGNAMTSDYTWSFMTGDFIAPTVISTSPANGATGVAINSSVTATFSDVMQSSTINTNTFTVSDGKGNISGRISYSGTTATFTPSSNLSDSTTYTARIASEVRDLTGNPIASAYTWSFTTGLATITPTPTPMATPTPTPVPTPSIGPVNKGVVFGSVYDIDKEPLKGVAVTITGADFSVSTETDETGYYEFRNLASGDYTLTYEKEGYQIQIKDISLGEGEELDLGTIIMDTIGKGKISGHILDTEGEPISGAKIRLKREKKKLKTMSSDMNGFFEFGDLEAGQYKIFVTKKSYKRTKETVLLEEGEEKEIEIQMKKTKK